MESVFESVANPRKKIFAYLQEINSVVLIHKRFSPSFEFLREFNKCYENIKNQLRGRQPHDHVSVYTWSARVCVCAYRIVFRLRAGTAGRRKKQEWKHPDGITCNFQHRIYSIYQVFVPFGSAFSPQEIVNRGEASKKECHQETKGQRETERKL